MASKGDEASATFSFSLESNAPEVGKDSAAALEELQAKLQGGIASLRQMNQALRNLKGAGVSSEGAMGTLKDQIAAQRAVIAQTQAKYINLGGTFAGVSRQIRGGGNPFAGFSEIAKAATAATDAQAARLGHMREIFGGLGGPIGKVGNGILDLNGKMAGASGTALGLAAATVAVSVAVIALAAATARAAAGLFTYAVRVADARRAELLRLEGLTKIRYFMFGFGQGFARAADKADFLQNTIDSVSASVAIGRDKVAEYAAQLYRMGLRSGNLQAALRGMATTAAVQGEGQAAIFASWAAGAAMTGQSVRRLADDVQARLGGIAKAQMLSLEVQQEKLHEGFRMLFSGLHVDPLLEGVSKITELFTQSTVSGRALKQMMTVLFQPVIDAVGVAGPLVKRFFQGMILGTQALVIAFLQVRNWMRKTFGDNSVLKGLDTTRIAVNLGKLAVVGLAGAFFALAVAVGLVVGPFFLAGWALLRLWQVGKNFVAWWSNEDWGALGSAIVEGIVNGLKRGWGKLKAAAHHLADVIKGAFASSMEIHSPSRVGDRMGFAFPQGIARGQHRGRALVVAASRATAADMMRESFAAGGGYATRTEAFAAAGVETRSAPRRGGARGGATTVTIGDIHVHSSGGDAKGIAADIVAEVRRQVEEAFAGIAVEFGTAEAG